MADPINRALMAHRPLFLSGLLLDGQYRLPPAKPGRNHSQPASGLAAALAGVECVIDTATGPSPEQQAATAFFIAAARNLQQAGVQVDDVAFRR